MRRICCTHSIASSSWLIHKKFSQEILADFLRILPFLSSLNPSRRNTKRAHCQPKQMHFGIFLNLFKKTCLSEYNLFIFVCEYSLTKINSNTMNGKSNIAMGFLTMGFFMAYGFLLIYLRDFAPGKEEWINTYSIGKHFESRLAHVHGNLFAFLNILIGYLLIHFKDKLKNVKTISWLALTGLLMPIGILTEVYFGLPPALVLIGAIAMTSSVVWLGVAFFKMESIN